MNSMDTLFIQRHASKKHKLSQITITGTGYESHSKQTTLGAKSSSKSQTADSVSACHLRVESTCIPALTRTHCNCIL